MEIVAGPRNKQGVNVFSRRKSAKVTNLDDLTAGELAFARVYAATLKATGWSWRYISDTLNIQGSLIKTWCDDPEWMAMVEKVAGDIVEGAAEHLRQSSVDFAEMLRQLAATATDEAVKLRAIESGLDRVGVTKVNKSESIVTRKDSQEHSLAADLFERMEGLPLDTQQAIAKLATELDELVASARGTE